MRIVGIGTFLCLAAACSSGSGGGGSLDLAVDSVAAYETGVNYDPDSGEFYTGSPDGLRLDLDDETRAEVDAARARVEQQLCETFVDETTRASAILEVMIAMGEADERWIAGFGDAATDAELAAADELSAELRSAENIEEIQRQIVDRCDIDVPDGFEFETSDDLFSATSDDSECDVLFRTYEVAIEAWYAQYGYEAGHPSGDDLVNDGFVREYDDVQVQVVQGSGSTFSSVRSSVCSR